MAEAVGVAVGAVGVSGCDEGERECGCWAWVELGEGFAMVDASLTAVVGPRVVVKRKCDCHASTPVPHNTCRPDTCLNGGRCVPTLLGTRSDIKHTLHLKLTVYVSVSFIDFLCGCVVK